MKKLVFAIIGLLILTVGAVFYFFSKPVQTGSEESLDLQSAESLNADQQSISGDGPKQKQPLDLSQPSGEDRAETITFTADEGSRVEYASNPGVKFTDDEEVILLYENRSGDGVPFQIAYADESSDWLEFGESEDLTREDQDSFHAIKLATDLYRFYGYRPTVGSGEDETGMKSSSSTDGKTFTEDEGYRYLFEEEDMGNIGTYDFYFDQSGGIVLLYVGDKFGKNNVRRAYSEDGGWTFEFDRGNVLGDDNRDTYEGTFVDQSVLRLDDGRVFLIAMKSGKIYGFVSNDDAKTFEYDGLLAEPADFADLGIGSLHDPKMVKLPDGRIRFYITGKEFTSGDPEDPTVPQHIVSVTGVVQ